MSRSAARHVATSLLCLLAGAPGVARAVTPANPSATEAGVVLQWTSPGDDDLVGTAFRYDLRWSLIPITPQNWSLATPCVGLPPPSPAGTPQSFAITGLVPDRLYYFAIRSQDLSGNWSPLSNVAARWSTRGASLLNQSPVAMSPPSPNPARAGTQFVISLPYAEYVSIDVLDVGGRRVRTLAAAVYSGGPTTFGWGLDDAFGRRLPVGAYWMRARMGGSQIIHRIVVGG